MKKRSPLQINLGTKIRMLRKEKGMSQEAFAMAIGFHRTYIGMVERGEKNLTIESLDKICVWLGIPISEALNFAQQNAAR